MRGTARLPWSAGIGAGGLPGRIHRVALGCTGHEDDRLRQCQLPFRSAEALVGLPGVQGQGQRTGIGIADVLRCHADDAARDVRRITAPVEHPREPVQGGIRIRAAHRLVQGRDLLVERVALPVEAAVAAGQCSGNFGRTENPAVAQQLRGDLEQVQGTACVTVGPASEGQEFIRSGSDLSRTQAALRIPQRGLEDSDQRGVIQRFQDVHTRPGQQRVVQGK